MKYYLLFFFLLTFSKISSAQKIERINSGEIIKQSITFYDSSKYKDALTVLNKVSRSDTNYVWSVYEKAVNCEADSQFTNAIKYCREGLALTKQREYEPELYNTYGNTLSDLGQPDKAVQVFDQAIAKYPAYSLLYFNKGVALLALKRPAEAEAMFQKTLLINPYMYSAHFQLGYAALQQGKLIPSFLSIIGYLLVNPEGKYWSRSIGILDKIAKGTDEVLEFKKNKTGPADETYQEVEDILLSKIALDKSYKSLVSIDDPICRQIQALFEKLEYQKGNNDFWIQYYLPYYKQIFNQGKLEPFIFHIFSNVNLPVVKEYKKNNKKDLDKFVNQAGDYFNLIRATRELNFSKRDTIKEKYFFDDGSLIGKGTVLADGKTVTGPWVSYFAAGNKKAAGSYDAAGKRTGIWTYYFYLGGLKAKENYAVEKLTGTQEYYYENGNLSSRENYVNGNSEGLSTTYSYGGNVKSTANYRQGKKDGVERLFYSNGSLKAINNYVADALTGTATEYFKSGKVKNTGQYLAGKQQGPYKSYYETSRISSEGQFIKDNAEGEWKFYYESGKLKEKRNYLNNNEEDIHQEYYENGQLSSAFVAKKGKTNGEVLNYYKDGKVFSKAMYDNGIIKSIIYTDKAGKSTYQADSKNGLTHLFGYTEDGYKKSHGNLNAKGDLDGADTLFYPSGKINQINEYKNGDLNGPSVTYYLNGKKKSEVAMADGKANGYSKTFHVNGTAESEGWMQADEHQGEWVVYDEKGRLNTRSYYLDDDLDGFKETYSPNGKKNLEEKYHLGWLEKVTEYDTTEKVMLADTFPKATGKYKLIYPDGKTMTEGTYSKGEFEGAYKTYYFDGSVESSYYYKQGLLDSTYVSYYYGGKKNTEGRFEHGNKVGIWKLYTEEGKLSSTINYINDLLNGERTYFFETGVKDYIGTYKDDILNGDTKKYDPDGTLAYQIKFEDSYATSYTYQAADGKLTPPANIAVVNGSLKAYFPNGKPSRVCSYSDGLKNGHDIIYYSNGQIRSEDSPVYGLANGLSNEFYPNGKLKSAYNYIEDVAEGICKEYYPTGTIQKEIALDNGLNHGPTKYFDGGGKLTKTMWYYYGKLISVK
ncbi:tetratricopeptide repeat protein [Mucilaginibacter sp. FT3.2]|uniref:tetratricopeptide repeat protein n=1 Tax=Mucilaginibacter sp. FT3.2 TaxID=2723090 RepID=UPI00161BDCDE|nr:tetratricopeptide repeat protein [Mucilaginibacter sp. FT3.2]MBB6233884.1 antitoxin component YwqK of YwqJK toxin-antitoxin module/Tfp pilus assembly protein PilF [Mucilaginibacter sp. FT3.2]